MLAELHPPKMVTMPVHSDETLPLEFELEDIVKHTNSQVIESAGCELTCVTYLCLCCLGSGADCPAS
jgi:hypothetical protein